MKHTAKRFAALLAALVLALCLSIPATMWIVKMQNG